MIVVRQNQRWNLFGHVLRLNVDTPAQIAMDNYCNNNNEQKFRGRTQTTLPVILFHEYHVYKQSLKSHAKIDMCTKTKSCFKRT